jgi:hypothetical protein
LALIITGQLRPPTFVGGDDALGLSLDSWIAASFCGGGCLGLTGNHIQALRAGTRTQGGSTGLGGKACQGPTGTSVEEFAALVDRPHRHPLGIAAFQPINLSMTYNRHQKCQNKCGAMK